MLKKEYTDRAYECFKCQAITKGIVYLDFQQNMYCEFCADEINKKDNQLNKKAKEVLSEIEDKKQLMIEKIRFLIQEFEDISSFTVLELKYHKEEDFSIKLKYL